MKNVTETVYIKTMYHTRGLFRQLPSLLVDLENVTRTY